MLGVRGDITDRWLINLLQTLGFLGSEIPGPPITVMAKQAYQRERDQRRKYGVVRRHVFFTHLARISPFIIVLCESGVRPGSHQWRQPAPAGGSIGQQKCHT